MACNVRLRPQRYNEIRNSDEIMTCENCSRILYYVQPPTAEEMTAGGQNAEVTAWEALRFGESEPLATPITYYPAMSNSPEIIAHIDGGSRGNPGPAAYGVSVETADGQPVTSFAKYLGQATNNFAEYQGLLAALDYALSNGYARLRVFTDSELMARQISGHYKVRSPDLKLLYEKAQAMIAKLSSFSIKHVYREQNREADRLANQAMDDAARGKISHSRELSSPPAPSPAPFALAPIAGTAPTKTLAAVATFRDGTLHPHASLPLAEGEQVELEIRRKK
jgi:ribonuclease HI